MYEINFIYQDFKTYTVQVETAELEKFMKCMKQNVEYYDKEKAVGFWLPLENIRCCYIVRREEKPPEVTVQPDPIAALEIKTEEPEEQKCV